jgi:multidrug resistance efflux pump
MLVKEGATPRLAYEKSQRESEAAKAERDVAADLARGAEDRLSLLTKTADAARQSVEAGRQALDRAKETAAAAEIHSPVTGLVVGRTKQVGEEVTPDVQDLFQIATDLSALEAVVEPDRAALDRIRPGQDALITVADAPDAIAAHVTEIVGNEVIVRFASPSPAVRPGVTAQVRIKVS